MKRKIKATALAIFIIALLLLLPFVADSRKAAVLAEGDLGDGRILRVEGVSFGQRHEIGSESLVTRVFGPWLPWKVSQCFESSVPRNTINSDRNGLVVWVNAVSAMGRTNVDCQGLTIEFRDNRGNIFGDDHPHWFGGKSFWRVGHVFYAFPRDAKTLSIRAKTWRSTNTIDMVVPNPGFTRPAAWTGATLPLTVKHGEHEVVCTRLNLHTNSLKWRNSASIYWEPELQLRRHGETLQSGWEVDWSAEDRYGNKGKELAVSEPVLKFFCSYVPSATNLNAAVGLLRLPAVRLPLLTNTWWNFSSTNGTRRVVVLGVFPAGVYTFSENGELLLTNPPARFGAVSGGAKSGWMSQSQRTTPSRRTTYYGHYTDVPVIYVKIAEPAGEDLIGIRLIDEQNRLHLAEAEPQGKAGGVLPFLIRIPDNVESATPQLVLLSRVQAEFTVQTPAGAAPR